MKPFFTPDDGAPGGGGTGTAAPPEPPAASTPPPETPPSLVAPATPPVAATDGKPASWVNADGTFVEGWTNQLPEDIRSDSLSLGKYKTVEELARGTINKDKLIGRKGVFVPNEKSTPEEVSEFRKALGVPDSVEGYEPKPERLPEGISWNDELAKPFLAVAHKHNISKAALKELIATHIQVEQYRGNAMVQQAQAKVDQEFNEGMADLRNTWKGETDNKMMRVRTAAAILGVDVNDIGFRSPAIVKAFALMAERYIAEDKLVQGNGGLPSALNGPAMAKDIRTNKLNPYYERYQNGDPDIVNLARQYDTMK